MQQELNTIFKSNSFFKQHESWASCNFNVLVIGGAMLKFQLIHVELPVSDFNESLYFYTELLGFKLISPETEVGNKRYASFEVGDITFAISWQLDTIPHPGDNFVEITFLVDDVDEYFEILLRNGVEILESPQNQDFGLRTIKIKDPDGYILQFGSYLKGEDV